VHEVAGEDQDSGTIDHRVLVIDHRDKAEILGSLVDRDGKTLVFARTRAYAEMLAEANAAHVDVCQLETAALGFDHAQLTAALLDHWNMPKFLVQTVAAPRIASHRRSGRPRSSATPVSPTPSPGSKGESSARPTSAIITSWSPR